MKQVDGGRPWSRGRWPGALLLALVVALASGAVGWASATVLTPAEDPLAAADYTYVKVKPGEVGSTVKLNAVAKWAPSPVGSSRAAGVVTEVVAQPGESVSQGDVLFRVDQRPVSVAQGDIPAYRAIGQAAQGADVAQLQRMLISLGYYDGSADGTVGTRTVRAIRAWQKARGVDPTGVVALDDIIYVPLLPTRVSLDGEVIARGRIVAGGEQVVRALPPSPEFHLPVTETQAAMMPTGTRVEVTSPDGERWPALAGRQVAAPDSGTVNVSLEPADGAPICGGSCSQVPVTGEALLSAEVVTAEKVAGLVVPSAALVTAADGEIYVVDRDGERINVEVVTSARGMSIVEGAKSGTMIRIPGKKAGK